MLHCVSAYPTPVGSREPARDRDARRRVRRARRPVRPRHAASCAAVAAVALGACIYERHLVLDGDTTRSIAPCRARPPSSGAIVTAMEQARRARRRPQGLPAGRGGQRDRQPPRLYARRALRAGDTHRDDDVIALRPATGAAPRGLPRARRRQAVARRRGRRAVRAATTSRCEARLSEAA